MGKTLFVLELPEPEPRKKQARPVQKHRNKKLYSRKTKHRGRAGEGPGNAGAFVIGAVAPGNAGGFILRGPTGRARFAAIKN